MSKSIILFRGLDWLEVVVKFQDKPTHDIFLNDIHRIFQARPESSINYIDKKWSIHSSGSNGYRRYLQDSSDGFTLFLDNRTWMGIGNAWPLRIILQKPSTPSQSGKDSPPLLWSIPFEAMKNILDRINGFYGDFTHQVARVDLCAHWVNDSWEPKLDEHACFITRLKKPLVVPDYDNEDNSSAGAFIFGRAKDNNINNSVTSTIYSINRRIKDLPHSFNPVDCYPELPGKNSRIWNTEFKIWTRFLKRRGIDTLESLEKNHQSLWTYLTSKSLSLRVPNGKDSKKDRWKTHPIWRDVQNAFGEKTLPLKRVHVTPTPLLPEQIMKRIEGKAKDFTVSLEGWQGETTDNLYEQFISNISRDWFTNESLRSRMEKRDVGNVLKEGTDK